MPALLLVLSSLLACGTPADWGTPTVEDAVFPHADGYDAGTAHGADYLARGMAGCDTCHAEGGTAPACASCHAAYPHPEGFVAGEQHGVGTWGPTGTLEACAACHGDAALTAGASLGCSACHQTWPHPAGWTEGGLHGQAVLASGSAVAACGSCHGGEALDGGRVGGACATCHPSYPHPAGWSDGAVHGAFEGASTAGSDACASCHGGEDGGTAQVACSRCHATYPHPADWTVAHIGRAAPLGEGACMACHEAGDGPATMVAPCATACHGGAE